jgi:hypothetical protein
VRLRSARASVESCARARHFGEQWVDFWASRIAAS